MARQMAPHLGPQTTSPVQLPPPQVDPLQQQLQQQQVAAGEQEIAAGQAAADAQAQMAPTIAAAFATRASEMLALPDETTGVVPSAESVISKMVTSDEFVALDPVTQAAVVAAVKRAMAPGASGAARAAAQQAAGAQAGPSVPGVGRPLTLVPPGQTGLDFGMGPMGDLNADNTRWQDVFGMFPGLFG